jgi:hypothetical protein
MPFSVSVADSVEECFQRVLGETGGDALGHLKHLWFVKSSATCADLRGFWDGLGSSGCAPNGDSLPAQTVLARL